MFNTITTRPYIAQPATTPFRWGWDFNHWVPWMLHYPLRPPRKTHRMLQLKLTKPPGSMRRSRTSTNTFRIFYRIPMPSIRNAMFNTRCHTSFKWETKFGCTCRNNVLQGPMGSFTHSVMVCTPSLRMWVTVVPRPSFEEYLVIVDRLVLRLPVEDGAHSEVEIMGSCHLLWNLFGFLQEYCNGKGMLTLV